MLSEVRRPGAFLLQSSWWETKMYEPMLGNKATISLEAA
jgi:hypothetical protein